MTSPLAMLVYENLLPGSQLMNRLQDLGYRVQSLAGPETLVSQARDTRPFVVIIDLESQKTDLCGAIQALKSNPDTQHIPVLALVRDDRSDQWQAARSAGANLVAGHEAILPQLAQLLDQILAVD